MAQSLVKMKKKRQRRNFFRPCCCCCCWWLMDGAYFRNVSHKQSSARDGLVRFLPCEATARCCQQAVQITPTQHTRSIKLVCVCLRSQPTNRPSPSPTRSFYENVLALIKVEYARLLCCWPGLHQLVHVDDVRQSWHSIPFLSVAFSLALMRIVQVV